MRHGFILMWRIASGDQCSKSTCLHQALRVWLVFSWTDNELFLRTLCLGDIMWMHTYCTLLSDQLQPAICKKQRGLLQKGVILQHDNDFHHTTHLSDSTENWIDGLGIVTTSATQSRLNSKWFSFVWTTKGIVWRRCLRMDKKTFNNMSGSFYNMMPTKTSML